MKALTVPRLMAMAHGLDCDGPCRCFYCGSPCGEAHPASEYVRDSFNGRNAVAAPGSPWVCPGCVLCLREDCDLIQIDGTSRHVAKAAMRAFSWVVTPREALAGSKAHMAELRGACLAPPPPPYAIVLSDSGKTHQLYRGVVVHSAAVTTVTLETERVDYQPHVLREWLDIAGKIAATCGKPALSEPLGWSQTRHLMERYRDGEGLALTWTCAGSSPLGRLAAWLTPKKEDAQHAYPSDLD